MTLAESNVSEIVAIVGTALAAVTSLIILTAWVVSRVEGGTKSLEKSIDNLSSVITTLREQLEATQQKQQNHEVRISVLESRGLSDPLSETRIPR